MKISKALFVLGVFFSLQGCVTRAVQTEDLLAAPPEDLPLSKENREVDFIAQSAGYCGPATLAMAMRWAGKSVTVNDVAAQVYTPGFKGTLQSDMISASRRQGLMAIPIHNLKSLLTEVAAGHPVIVFENLSLEIWPQWHYAVILGYDLQKEEVVLHSGPDAYYRWDMRKFERSWMLGGYWGLVILPAGMLAASADEKSHGAAAVGLELAKKDKEAEKSYLAILEKWPNNLVSLIGLGNITYRRGEKKAAIQYLRKAVESHPNSAAARHNLGVAQGGS